MGFDYELFRHRSRVAGHECGHVLVDYLTGAELVSVDVDRQEMVASRGGQDRFGQLAGLWGVRCRHADGWSGRRACGPGG